jgi:hypothetical protein
MIRTALEFLKDELEAYFTERDPINYKAGNVVAVQAISKPDGTIAYSDEHHITLMLIGIEEERREGKRPHYIPTDDKKFLRLSPPVEIDIHILVAAHYSVYETALRDLSNAIGFFQANPVFDKAKNATLNALVKEPDKQPWLLIERMSMKLQTLSYEQQNNLWGMTGAKYLPSAVYKASMLTMFDTRSKEKVAAVTELNLQDS